MKDISNVIRIDKLTIDYTLSYFQDKPYLYILFIYPENYIIDETNPTIKLIQEVAKDYNFNILREDVNIPDCVITIIKNNFYVTNIEEGITTATITLIDRQLDLSSLFKETDITININKKEDLNNHIIKLTEYYSENGKINILLEQHISKDNIEDYGDEYTYTVMIEDAIEREDYEEAEKYSKLRDLITNKNT